MEPRRFDALVQSLASTKSRRAVLKRLVAGAVAAVPAIASTRGAEAGQPKVTICHKGTTITVALPALPAHVAHGDTVGACCPPDTHPCTTSSGTPACCQDDDDDDFEGRCEFIGEECFCVDPPLARCTHELCSLPGACAVHLACHC